MYLKEFYYLSFEVCFYMRDILRWTWSGCSFSKLDYSYPWRPCFSQVVGNNTDSGPWRAIFEGSPERTGGVNSHTHKAALKELNELLRKKSLIRRYSILQKQNPLLLIECNFPMMSLLIFDIINQVITDDPPAQAEAWAYKLYPLSNAGLQPGVIHDVIKDT